MKRRRMLLAAVVPVALLAFLPAVEAGADLGPPPVAGTEGASDGFHGFDGFETHADAKVLTLTGFLNAFREDNSVVGSVSEIIGPPPNSRNIAAFFLRGQGATFVYGVIGGPGGARGTLPDPPPGEANAFYPTDDPPYEMTWTGPVGGLGFPQAVDSRFHAKASDVPTGRADGAVTAVNSPGYFSIGQATVVSHTEPADGGVLAEGVSVVHELKVGPLLIQNIVSRAYAFVPTSGDPKGIATTVIDGAKVGETPVQITDKGIVVADQTNPLNQEQVNKAMADAGYPQVRLIPSVAKASDDGSGVNAAAGTLEFVKHDEKFGASNPQGFSGGGFTIGGAAAVVSTRRCAPDCGGGSSSDIIGSDPSSSSGSDGSSSGSTGGADSESGGATLDSGDLGYSSDSSSTETLTTDTSGTGVGGSANLSSGSGGGGFGAGGGLSTGGSGSSGASTAEVTPPTNEQAAAGVSTPGAGVAVQQQAVAYTELGPKSADWLRDLYLMGGLALGIIFVGQRLARALG